jgi:hypothetical protein
MPRPVPVRSLTTETLKELIVVQAGAMEGFYRSWIDKPFMSANMFRYVRELRRRENANARARESRSREEAGR